MSKDKVEAVILPPFLLHGGRDVSPRGSQPPVRTRSTYSALAGGATGQATYVLVRRSARTISHATGMLHAGAHLLRLATLALAGNGYEQLGRSVMKPGIRVMVMAGSGKRL